ncbi:MAG: vitamin K epoxide reductase [Chloroflexi bacterium]|nr:vitamin K epoxide reductase [Chloroflexota bacterium]
MYISRKTFLLAFFLSLLLLIAPVQAQQEPVVRAVMFYSPTCPHCHKVLQEGLPPIIEKYGDQFEIVLINVQTAGGQRLYQSAIEWLPIPDNKLGVPALIVGRELLLGDVEIPARLPDIIEKGLAQGGIDWPEIPGLAEALAQTAAAQAKTATQTVAPEPQPAQEMHGQLESSSPGEQTANQDLLAGAQPLITTTDMTLMQRLALDPVGNGAAVVLLVVMLVSLGVVGNGWFTGARMPGWGEGWRAWIFPTLALAGLGVSFYMAYVEVAHASAVCGPIGDCNIVQQSPYARLFGMLPIGVLGVMGYLAILALWFWQRFSPERLAEPARRLLAILLLFGVAFSLYLTFLEPFVIGAVCMWCLSSALIMTLLLWFVYRNGPETRESNTMNAG